MICSQSFSCMLVSSGMTKRLTDVTLGTANRGLTPSDLSETVVKYLLHPEQRQARDPQQSLRFAVAILALVRRGVEADGQQRSHGAWHPTETFAHGSPAAAATDPKARTGFDADRIELA